MSRREVASCELRVADQKRGCWFLVAGYWLHTVFILYGAGRGMGSDLKTGCPKGGRSKQRPYRFHPFMVPARR